MNKLGWWIVAAFILTGLHFLSPSVVKQPPTAVSAPSVMRPDHGVLTCYSNGTDGRPELKIQNINILSALFLGHGDQDITVGEVLTTTDEFTVYLIDGAVVGGTGFRISIDCQPFVSYWKAYSP